MSINGGKGGVMRMQLETRTAAALAITAVLGLSSMVACSKVGELKAKMGEGLAACPWVGASRLFSRQVCRRKTRRVHHIDEHTRCLTARGAIQDCEALRVQTAGDPLLAQRSVDA